MHDVVLEGIHTVQTVCLLYDIIRHIISEGGLQSQRSCNVSQTMDCIVSISIRTTILLGHLCHKTVQVHFISRDISSRICDAGQLVMLVVSVGCLRTLRRYLLDQVAHHIVAVLRDQFVGIPYLRQISKGIVAVLFPVSFRSCVGKESRKGIVLVGCVITTTIGICNQTVNCVIYIGSLHTLRVLRSGQVSDRIVLVGGRCA